METKSFISPALSAYIETVSLREHPALARLREQTASHAESRMQITPSQGQFLQFLVKLIDARRTLEIGVFTGYSSLAVALALPEDGRITALDVSEEYTSVARRHWHEAGVSHKIDLRIAPAAASLDNLIHESAAPYDFAFIDADKPSYALYFEKCLKLVRPNGLIVLDNMLRAGRVLDDSVQDASTQAICEFNKALHANKNLISILLPIADGLTLVLR